VPWSQVHAGDGACGGAERRGLSCPRWPAAAVLPAVAGRGGDPTPRPTGSRCVCGSRRPLLLRPRRLLGQAPPPLLLEIRRGQATPRAPPPARRDGDARALNLPDAGQGGLGLRPWRLPCSLSCCCGARGRWETAATLSLGAVAFAAASLVASTATAPPLRSGEVELHSP